MNITKNQEDDLELNLDITMKATAFSSLDRELQQVMKVGKKIQNLMKARQAIVTQDENSSS